MNIPTIAACILSVFAIASPLSEPQPSRSSSSAGYASPPVADPLPVGSLWLGTQTQEGRKEGLTIIMHVGSRLDEAFDATVWWPDFNGGLIKASGRVGPKKEITLDFGAVLFNPKLPNGQGQLIEGAKTKGTLARDTVECQGKIQRPEDKEPIEVAYRLKRVQ